MANNYECGATHVPADCFAPGGAEAAVLINGELQDILEQDDRPEEFDDAYYAGCLDTEMGADGSLYLSSGDEYFCQMSFEYLIAKLAERKLITKSFGISTAYYCDKLRPDEHGGIYWRALPSGEVLSISTQLDCLTDEQFRHLVNVRESPATYTSAPDA